MADSQIKRDCTEFCAFEPMKNDSIIDPSNADTKIRTLSILKDLIPMMAEELANDIISVNGVKTR